MEAKPETSKVDVKKKSYGKRKGKKAAEGEGEEAPKYIPGKNCRTPRGSHGNLKKPGQVVILLTGKDAGKRVIFLKHLSMKFILVNGPLNYNGVPLSCIRRHEVIATSTTVNMDKDLNLDKYDLAYFIKPAKKKGKTQQAFFEEEKEVKEDEESPEKLENQKEIDASMEKSIEKKYIEYLKTEFTVNDETRPHLMKF